MKPTSSSSIEIVPVPDPERVTKLIARRSGSDVGKLKDPALAKSIERKSHSAVVRENHPDEKLTGRRSSIAEMSVAVESVNSRGILWSSVHVRGACRLQESWLLESERSSWFAAANLRLEKR